MGINPELLSRYNRGLCSEQERRVVEDWLNGERLEDAPDTGHIPAALKQQIGQRVWRRLDPVGQRPSAFILRWKEYYQPVGIAASITLAVALTYLVILRSPHVSPVPLQTVRTGMGQRANVTLPDGTQVALNSDSELQYPTSFSDTLRRVFLRGEALFTVTKNAGKPFLVRTGHSETRVLGTVFNLKAYPTETTTTLAVAEGRVVFSNADVAGDADTLLANQQIVLRDGLLQAKTDVDASRASAWQKSILIFDDLTIAQIATALERWYGVQVNIESDALKDQRYTGTFTRATLPAVLRSMAYAIDFHYEIHDKTVTLYAHER
ncbi:FecR family protein [Dawidia soli]|uniref:FecR domain-containing protein n=1 Tax=Dawidia soli TaxID=2782352 RepID=A0AAP2GHK2_9BACT|nr:FecR domain-containing protein [Dawidia soli]MBT1687306.1 FecR domain-containing protein [Dawidia soli]